MQEASENKENETHGCLSLNNRNYPVVEGLNTVGRNPDASINIKHLNVSKHHAVITVVDGAHHYISDFKSCNGTVVDNKKLSPLRLYELKDGASVRFGDVFCTYRRLGGGKAVQKNLDESQQYSDSFYASGTQGMNFINGPEGISFNELPTQVFTTSDLNINEMPTQLHQLLPDDSSNDSIDFMTMQKASESQAFRGTLAEVNHEEIVESNADEEVTSHNKDTTAERDSDKLTPIQPVMINSRPILDSDTDDELAATDEKEAESASKSTICPVGVNSRTILDSSTYKDPGGKKIIEDDSDTEEYDVGDQTKSKYIISDDSETDIDDDESAMESLKLVASEPPESSRKEIKDAAETPKGDSQVPGTSRDVDDAPAADSYKNEEGVDILTPIQPVMINSRPILDSDTDDELAATDEKEAESASTSTICPDGVNSRKEIEDAAETSKGDSQVPGTSRDVDDAPDADSPKNEEGVVKTLSQNGLDTGRSPIHGAEETEERAETSTSRKNFSEESSEKKEETGKLADQGDDEPSGQNEKENDIFLQPTQTLDIFVKSPNVDEEIMPPPNEVVTEETTDIVNHQEEILKSPERNDDIFFQPTQTLDIFSEVKSPKVVDEICLLPTQVLTTTDIPERSNEDEVFQEVSALNCTDSDADLSILPPTQQEPSTSNHLFKNPSPVKQFRKKPSEDDENMLPPTQALTFLHDDGTDFDKVEDELHQIFASQSLLCTQQLVDVLDTSGQVVDDSLLDVSSIRLIKGLQKPQPLAADIEEILEDRKEEVEVRTYSRKRSNKGEEKKSQEESKPESESRIEKDGDQVEELKLGAEDSNPASRRSERTTRTVEGVGDKESVTVAETKEITPTGEGSDKKENKIEKNRQKSESEVFLENKPNNSDGRSVHRRTRGNQVEEPKKTEKEEKSQDSNPVSSRASRSAGRKTRTIEDEESVAVAEVKETTPTGEGPNKKESKIEMNRQKDESEVSLESKPSTSDGRSVSRTKVEEPKKRGKEEKSQDSNPGSSRASRSAGRKTRTIEDNESVAVAEVKKTTQTRESSDEKENTIEKNEEKGATEVTLESKPSTRRTRGNKIDQPKSVTAKKRGEEQSSEENNPGGSRSSRRIAKKTIIIDDVEDKENLSEEPKSKTKEPQPSTSAEGGGKTNSQNKNISGESSGVSARSKRRTKPGTDAEQQTASKEVNSEQPNTSNDNQIKDSDSDSVRPRGRRKKKDEEAESETLPENEEQKDKPEATTARRTKRKKDPSPPPDTPTKKRATALRRPSANSEDDFVVEASKQITSTPRKSLRRIEEEPSISQPVKKSRRLSANSRRQKREDEEKEKLGETITPERSRRVTKPKVVFTMMDNPELESLIRQLGGSVVDTVDVCTVLVTETVKRSQKLLCAVAQAKPVCSPQWLLASKKAFTFQDPWEYILVDKEAEKKWNFSLKESLRRSSTAKLLENHTFQLMVDNAADVLKGAIESCGGKCVTRNLPKCDTEHLIIVSLEKHKNKYKKIVQQNSKIRVVEAEAIFDGTLRQEFKFDQFKIP